MAVCDSVGSRRDEKSEGRGKPSEEANLVESNWRSASSSASAQTALRGGCSRALLMVCMKYNRVCTEYSSRAQPCSGRPIDATWRLAGASRVSAWRKGALGAREGREQRRCAPTTPGQATGWGMIKSTRRKRTGRRTSGQSPGLRDRRSLPRLTCSPKAPSWVQRSISLFCWCSCSLLYITNPSRKSQNLSSRSSARIELEPKSRPRSENPETVLNSRDFVNGFYAYRGNV